MRLGNICLCSEEDGGLFEHIADFVVNPKDYINRMKWNYFSFHSAFKSEIWELEVILQIF